MDGMVKMNRHPLLVATDNKKPPPPFPVVRLGISFLALLTACLFTVIIATIVTSDPAKCAMPTSEAQASSSPSTKCYHLPGAGPILQGLMWCTPPQAALGLALLLAGGRRSRRALAYITLAVTGANHCSFAKFAVIVYVATSEDTIGIIWAIVLGAYFVVAAVALLGLLGVLILLGGEFVD